VELGGRGTFHVSDAGECTWYDFATAIAAGTQHACRLEPCTTQDFPRPAPRPAYSVLDVARTEAVLGPLPSWQENLSAVLRKLSPP
jgi:dTDP-4-dehydrorhamnose reductase